MSKIIIHNDSGVDDYLAVECVKKVMSRGFESGENQYCWVSTFIVGVRGMVKVVAMKTRGKTHTFKVWDCE